MPATATFAPMARCTIAQLYPVQTTETFYPISHTPALIFTLTTFDCAKSSIQFYMIVRSTKRNTNTIIKIGKCHSIRGE